MKDMVRVAALGDLHYGRASQFPMASWMDHVRDRADVLLLCGDLTDCGTEEDARGLARDLSGLGVPIVAVLGNHDFESSQERVVTKLLTDAGVQVLDGNAVEVAGIGFAGVKGFCGGFGRGALGPWGEPITKAFVQEAVNEALKLESALARLRTASRVCVLHYSPIRETVAGEPIEILPYLGSSRLEEPLNRYPVDAIFHGHAHNGQLRGQTSKGSPVYNASMPLLLKERPHEPPLWIIELPTTKEVKVGQGS